ncbi:MAG: helix-turn-helix transcriptional regulator [Nocardioidaceae bacterium]
MTTWATLTTGAGGSVNRLRAYRMIEGASQEDLSGELLAISPQMVSAIEAGRRGFAGDLALIGYASEPVRSSDDVRTAPPPACLDQGCRTEARPGTSTARGGGIPRVVGPHPRLPEGLTLGPLPDPISLDELDDVALDVRYLLRHEQSGPIRNPDVARRAGGRLPSCPSSALTEWTACPRGSTGVPVVGLLAHSRLPATGSD